MSDDVLDLLEAAPAPPMAIDPYAAVLGGRRRLRRRRAGITVAGVAAAAVIVAVVTQLPAVNRAAPLPAVSSTSGATPAPTASAVLDFGDKRFAVRLGQQNGDPMALSFVELAADPSDTSWSLVGASSASGLWDEITYGMNPDGGDVILGVVPSGAQSVSAFFGGATDVPTESRMEALPGTPFDAFAIRVAAPATTENLWFLMWTDRDGRHRTTAPADVRSAVFTIPQTDDAVVLWGDGENGAWGLTGAGLAAVHRNMEKPTFHLAELVATASSPGWSAVYGLLPAGVRDVEVTLAPGERLDAGVQGQAVQDLDATAFLAVLDTSDAGNAGNAGNAGEWVTGVTWVNADGTRGSYSFGG